MDPSPLHSPKTGVDFWKPLSDGFTMGIKKGWWAEGGEERGLFCKRIKTQINFSLDRHSVLSILCSQVAMFILTQ